MCGIWGCVGAKGQPALQDAVARLAPVLRHRGPDDEGVAVLGPAAFGHTRLAILGPADAASRQPVCDGDYMLSFNGEIYNFKDIARELRRDGIAVGGRSDTEVLFQCLKHFGVRATLDRLDGMFAFAWFDRGKSELTLARDPMGEKFLYWAKANGTFWFGSEIKVLLAAGAASAAPNLARIDDFFFTGKVNGAATIFRDVQEVEPGTCVQFSAPTGRVTCSTYWSLTGSPRPSLAFAGAGDFGKAFAQAVASRRISDVPIGVLLSGGIDSSALASCLLDGDDIEGIDLYFADNRNPEFSERSAVDAFVSHLRGAEPGKDIRFHPNFLEFGEYHTRMRHLTWHYDEPLQFMNSPLLGGLCDMARHDGLKVLLSGEGSDEILHGYDRFKRTLDLLGSSPSRDAVIRNLYLGGGIDNAGLVRELCGRAGEGAEATEAWAWLDRHVDTFPVEQLQLLFSQRYRLQTLLQRQDRIGMASSIEIRVPFLAPWLVKWVNTLGPSALFDSERQLTKLPLRAAMQDRLPDIILTKKKEGFPSDMHAWLREDRMHRLLTSMIDADDSFTASYLDRAVARRIVGDHFAARRRYDVLIWMLYSLECWHDVFARQVAPAPAIARQSAC
ncbi:MAG TPA: asparagine synthase (glutamine-hydrolyzing) [Pseudolabrys sp.]|nr:asparagine synthase (glutamine-hydrolyzing) [Pseudolabrys sp.]